MTIIYLIAFAWWWCEFEPIHYFIDNLFGRFKPSFYLNWIHGGLSCVKCVAFWSAFAYTGELFTACLVSLLTFILNLCLQGLKKSL